MAISASSVFEVRTGGNDTNGGGFVTGAAGSDYSLQDAKNTVGADISTTDAVAAGTTTITSATANFGTTIVGNIVYFAGGTGSITGVWRQVTARASTTSITIDASIAISTGMTMNIGGALASPGQAAAILVSGNIAYIKSGTFTVTSATTNIAAGCVSAAGATKWVGYSTNRTLVNTDSRPTVILGTVSTTVMFAGAALFYNLIGDGNSQTSSRGFSGSFVCVRCKAQNFTNAAFVTGISILCEATACSASAAFSGTSLYCVAHGNTVAGFAGLSSYCVSTGNTGANTDGFLGNVGFDHCVAYGNGRDGFGMAGSSATLVSNCIAEGNVRWGFNFAFGSSKALINCATYNNNTGGSGGTVTTTSGVLTEIGSIAITAGSPFVDAANSDFRLNATANMGALLRGLGFPTEALSSIGLSANCLDYQDIGAVQHVDSGGSTTYIFPVFD